MQGDAQKQIRNVALFAGSPPSPMPGVGGSYKYTGKQHEYFENPTTEYIWENAQYASNYYKAHVQGIMPGTFETERGAYIRSMDIVEQTTGAKMPNDYQSIYFQDTRIKGLYTGAKVKYAGNTWLAISPFNVSDPLSSSVVRRCNAVWKHLDYYGNVLSEPFIFHDGRAQATASDYSDYGVLPRWYQKCVMQLNEETKELAYNRRIALGSSVIEVRGMIDFITDFSGDTSETVSDSEPPHVMFFDAQYQEPNLALDDMERGIAGAKAFSWTITLSCSNTMNVGGEQIVTVQSLRNGEEPDTAKHPVSYIFTSSDTSIATVDADGKVTAVSEGDVTITATLEQNPEISGSATISVSSEELQPEMVFTPELPQSLKQMQGYSGTVSVLRGGERLNTPIVMTVYGATDAADINLDGVTGALTITCFEASNAPLSMVLKADEYGLTVTRNVRLEGY